MTAVPPVIFAGGAGPFVAIVPPSYAPAPFSVIVCAYLLGQGNGSGGPDFGLLGFTATAHLPIDMPAR